MGGSRIIVHTGSCGKISRENALELAIDTMRKSVAALDNAGLSNIHICPETMGKVNQLGTLHEVLELCKVDERLIPCIDFGHLNARDLGSLKTKADFEEFSLQLKIRSVVTGLKAFIRIFPKLNTPRAAKSAT